MNEITVKAETQTPGRTTLPDSLRQWQRRVARLVGGPDMPASTEARKELLRDLRAAMWASGPEYVATSLLRLQAHYWRPDFTPAQAKELYADYIEDLSELPPDILDEAIREYRRNPEARFFPRTGELLGLAAKNLEERRRAISRLEAHVTRSEAIAHPKRSPEELARVKQAIKDAFKPFPEAAS